MVIWVSVVWMSMGSPQAAPPARSTANTTPTARRSGEVDFPQSWSGRWSGRVQADQPGGVPRAFDMRLDIGPTPNPARTSWQLTFNDNGRSTFRKSEISAVDAATGHYRLDDLNSVKVDAFLLGQTLQYQCLIGEQLVTVVFERDGEQMAFDLTLADRDQPTISGGENGMPRVEAYKIVMVQRGRLERQANSQPAANRPPQSPQPDTTDR